MLASWNGDIHNQTSPFNTKHLLHCVHKMFTQGTHLHDAKKIFDFTSIFSSRTLTGVKCRQQVHTACFFRHYRPYRESFNIGWLIGRFSPFL